MKKTIGVKKVLLNVKMNSNGLCAQITQHNVPISVQAKRLRLFFLQKTVEFWQCAHYMQSSCPAKFWAKLDSLNFCIFTCEFYCYIHYVNTSIMDCNCFKSFP